MVSTRSSSKRRPSDDIVPASPSKKPRRHERSEAKPTLTTLPAEVRELILKELLWQEEPIEFNSELYEKCARRKGDYHDYLLLQATYDYLLLQATSPLVSFDPEILRTCKQLYAEGSKVLYSNAVNCRVGRPFYGENFYLESDGPVVLLSRFSGMDLNLALNLPSAVLTKMSRCRVQVFVHHQKQWRDESLRRLKQRMEPLAQAIRESNWQHIEIQVIHIYGSSLMRFSVQKTHHARRFLKVLAPLRYVRGRTSVKITGLPTKTTSFLVDIMKSPAPSVDLSDMCSRLKDYKNALTGDDEYTVNSEQMEDISDRINHVFRKCDLAKDLEDVPTFLRRRERLMFLIAKYVLAAQEEVFGLDSADIPLHLPLSQPDDDYPHRNRFDERENEGDSEVETDVRGFDEGEWSDETDEENSDDNG